MFFAAKDTVERWSQAKDRKAIAKGLAKGMAQGIEQGLEQGREQGLEQGREQGREEVVALLKEHDVQLPPEVLSKLNGDGHSEQPA